MRKLSFVPCANSLGYMENVPDYIDSRVVAPNVAETFIKPAGARFARLSCGQLFYYNPNGVATVAATDIVNGTASVSVPATVQPFFCVDDVASISVVSTTAAVISAEWWG